MATKSDIPNTAKAHRDNAIIDISVMLSAIRDKMNAVADNPNPNWGTVGSLDYVKMQLGSILEHYNI